MAKKDKEFQEIDVSSLDSELAAAKTLEEGKGDLYIKIAAVVAFSMTLFHIYTRVDGLKDFVDPRGIHMI